MLKADELNTLYIRTDVSLFRRFGYVLKPKIQLRKQALSDETEEYLWVGWVAAMSVLSLFFLNNLFIYLSFKDKAVLYYLLAQLGGMIYITSYRFFFASIIAEMPVYSFWMSPDQNFEYYDLNSLLQHAGILAVLYGYIQFTRNYLNSQQTLPSIDKTLRNGITAYAVITGCIILVNLTF